VQQTHEKKETHQNMQVKISVEDVDEHPRPGCKKEKENQANPLPRTGHGGQRTQ
jgi:hypothetical protein